MPTPQNKFDVLKKKEREARGTMADRRGGLKIRGLVLPILRGLSSLPYADLSNTPGKVMGEQNSYIASWGGESGFLFGEKVPRLGSPYIVPITQVAPTPPSPVIFGPG